jgi:hypothetical protein
MYYLIMQAHQGRLLGFEARLKSIVVTSGSSSERQIALVDSTGALTGTWDRPAGTPGPITTTVTTSTNHGLTSGDRVAIDFSGSLMRDGMYVVTVTGLTTFTVQSLTTGAASGTCTIFTEDNIFLEIDTFSTVGLPVLIPGEGIRCPNGIYVVLGSSVTATLYYG